MILIHLPQ